MEKIKFTISKTGEVSVEGEGFKGKTCLEKSASYIQALGLKTAEQLKNDYYVGEEAGVTIYNS